jgi:hypothetical protein
LGLSILTPRQAFVLAAFSTALHLLLSDARDRRGSHRQGDDAAARPLVERALAITERVLGPEHPATATSLYNLALLTAARARLLLERALAVSEKVGGPEHPIRQQPSTVSLDSFATKATSRRPAHSLSARWRSGRAIPSGPQPQTRSRTYVERPTR